MQQEWICFDVFTNEKVAWMPYVLSLSSFIEMPLPQIVTVSFPLLKGV